MASLVAGTLRDRIGHPAVFYYGTALALLGMLALIALIPNLRRTYVQ